MIVPVAAFIIIKETYSPFVIAQHLLLAIGALAGLVVMHHIRWFRLLEWPLLLVVSLYYLGLYCLIGYYVVVRNLFDMTFVDFGIDIKSLINLVGMRNTILIILGCVIIFSVALMTLRRQSMYWTYPIKRWSWGKKFVFLQIFLLSAIQAPSVYGQYVYKHQLERNKVIVTPDNSSYEAEGDENVIILQLESTNALAMAGYLEEDGKKYDGYYMPHMKEVAKDGTFFPFFFSNQQQTIRAQEAILCGIPGNTGPRLAKRTNDIPTYCLPEKLNESGYDTIFMKGANNPNFMNTTNLMNAIGFSELHFGDVMKEGDKNWGWGYDDCTFYKRAFEFLNENHAEKKSKFVYMEVGSNHADFHPKKRYEFTHMLDGTETSLARYINATLEQDYCVGEFYKEFATYDPENTHLFILGDHPWGLMEGYAHYEGRAENFLVPMLYVPPRSRADEFASEKTVTDYYYSQSDIMPTIFDLLSGKAKGNSFAFELKKPTLISGILGDWAPSPYENCQVLHELYDGGKTAVVQGMKKYTYSHPERRIYYADLGEDLLEENRIVLQEDAEFSDFIQEYQCDRFEIRSEGG